MTIFFGISELGVFKVARVCTTTAAPGPLRRACPEYRNQPRSELDFSRRHSAQPIGSLRACRDRSTFRARVFKLFLERADELAQQLPGFVRRDRLERVHVDFYRLGCARLSVLDDFGDPDRLAAHADVTKLAQVLDDLVLRNLCAPGSNCLGVLNRCGDFKFLLVLLADLASSLLAVPALSAACVALRSTRYSSTKRRCLSVSAIRYIVHSLFCRCKCSHQTPLLDGELS